LGGIEEKGRKARRPCPFCEEELRDVSEKKKRVPPPPERGKGGKW